jgi:hypothetical protein
MFSKALGRHMTVAPSVLKKKEKAERKASEKKRKGKIFPPMRMMMRR